MCTAECTGSDSMCSCPIGFRVYDTCASVLGRTLSVPVTDIVRTGDKTVVPQEGMRNAGGGKVTQYMNSWLMPQLQYGAQASCQPCCL